MKGDMSDSENSPLPLSAYKEHQNHMLHKVVKGGCGICTIVSQDVLPHKGRQIDRSGFGRFLCHFLH